MDLILIKYEKELKALANHRRLKIVSLLKQRPGVCVLDIADELGVSFKTASKHLGRLFMIGILTRQQVGGEMHYRITTTEPEYFKRLLELL